jgi:hypothetical protein
MTPQKMPGKFDDQAAQAITLPSSFEEAEERSILAAMRPWPRLMEARLKDRGYESFADGDLVLEQFFTHKLRDPHEPDALAIALARLATLVDAIVSRRDTVVPLKPRGKRHGQGIDSP